MTRMGRTRITIETLQVIVTRLFGAGDPVSLRCGGCGAEARFALPDDAAAFARLGVRELFRRIEAGAVHFVETPAGVVLVCLESLA